MTRHTDKEIAQAARRFERLADTLDPETAKVEDTDDLRAIATAAETVGADDARLQEAVLLARAHGGPESGPSGNRTRNLGLKRPLLCRLS
jgi:hypothetical protein